MKRNIVSIDEARCTGCGLCAEACQEGAIQMVDGKARLMRDDYCDGLGHCLPSCPADAISIVEREAEAFDEAAVKQNLAKAAPAAPAASCAGVQARAFPVAEAVAPGPLHSVSQLRQWPVQIQLAPLTAPYYEDAHLLIAADCAAYAHANFHNRFMKNRVTLIGCPKLDPVDYSEKLRLILAGNRIKSLTVVRMEVPCCGGIQRAAVKALQDSGKFIPWQVVTLTTDGNIIDD
ncbi:MAG: ATP-binding protein [Christensenellales bacterium]